MGRIHRAFLLDATGFRQTVDPILTSLDSKDARPLFDQAIAVVKQTSPNDWILRLAGASLLDIRHIDSIGRPRTYSIENYLKNIAAIPSYEIGYWLLIVFSSFVQRCVGMGCDYSILEWVLQVLGWNQVDMRLLFNGMPTSLLLKPDAVSIPAPSPDDPYWNWMIPPHSKGRGWLSQPQALRVYHRLVSEDAAIRAFDPGHFVNLRVPEPEGQVAYTQRLQTVYERAIKMFESGLQAQRELFLTISYE